jgi:hypothetical protein
MQGLLAKILAEPDFDLAIALYHGGNMVPCPVGRAS